MHQGLCNEREVCGFPQAEDSTTSAPFGIDYSTARIFLV